MFYTLLTISIKLKVLIKFRASEVICVEIESQKAMKRVPFAIKCMYICIYVKCSSLHEQNTHQLCHQLIKVRILTICIKLKVLLKFGASEMICVELRAKKLSNVYRLL